MTYLHERPNWPVLTWDSQVLAPLLAAVRHKQGRLLGKMESLGFDLQAEAGLAVLTTDVIKSSAIEGEMMNVQDVRSSLARRLGLEGAGRKVNREVEGVVEMMLDATRNYSTPLTQERLFGWHASLFPTGRSGMLKIAVGAWRPKKAGKMQVVSGALGREKVHFEAPDADRLEREMTTFLEWFETTETDLVLMAGIAHLWFVTIHPFEDGNGRIGRTIADLALARADGTPQRFYSLSSQFEAERKDYYLQLEAAQHGEVDITSWLKWFLECLERALNGADLAQAGVLRKAKLWQRLHQDPVNERQRRVINRLFDNFKENLTTSKYAKLAKCSNDTALRDIRDLLARGVVVQNPGGGRNTSYRLAE